MIKDLYNTNILKLSSDIPRLGKLDQPDSSSTVVSKLCGSKITVYLNMDNDDPVAGFQFDVSGLALTGGSGGAAGDAGFQVSAGSGTVLGFSFTGATIDAGSGLLTVLSFTSVTDATTELSMDWNDAITDASGNVYTSTASGDIDHGEPDCSGAYYGDAVVDECGECGGDGIAEGACDCDGNVEDCAGACGGSAELDECGECNGSGAAEGHDCDGNCVDATLCGSVALSFGAVTDQSAEVLYSSNFDIGGFQFDTDGVELTGVSSDLGDATFSSATGIVVGFSFTGGSLPAGDGVLATLSFASTNDGATLSASSVTVSDAAAVTLASSGPGSVSVDGCYETDCAGVCYGDGAEDECGECNGDGIDEGACDCDGNVLDCAGDCGGSAEFDECGVCLSHINI